MEKLPIKLNQIWKQKDHSYYVLVSGRKGGKWKVKVLTEKAGVYAGTHTLSHHTIHQRYQLVK